MQFARPRGAGGALVALLFLVPLFAATARAGEEAQEPLPLPLHTLEGIGGHFTVPSAYLVNPGPPGDFLGLPSSGTILVHLGNGKHLEAVSASVTLGGRVELSYALDYLDMGDLPEDVERAFGDTVTIGEDAVRLHNLNARFQVLQEGDYDTLWLPAVTVGVHRKWNTTVDDLDDDLSGGLRALGIRHDSGWDFTLTATKLFADLPFPTALSVTARYTKAAHLGLFGFTDTGRLVGEVAICSAIADGVFLAAEYRQKPSTYQPVDGLLDDEDDWWTIDVCFPVNSHLTVSFGYGHFGKLLNHRSNKSFGLALKYEF